MKTIAATHIKGSTLRQGLKYAPEIRHTWRCMIPGFICNARCCSPKRTRSGSQGDLPHNLGKCARQQTQEGNIYEYGHPY